MRRPHRTPDWVLGLLSWLGLVAAMNIGAALLHFVRYPIGGGAFHAMFAYSDQGRVGVALEFAGLICLAVCLTSALLNWLRLGLPAWAQGLAAAAASYGTWLDVATWPHPVSAEFRQLADTLRWALPLVCGILSASLCIWLNRTWPSERASMRSD